ncbi:MAG: PHB depolymerase family esterase, partial [Caldimonas sp.]
EGDVLDGLVREVPTSSPAAGRVAGPGPDAAPTNPAPSPAPRSEPGPAPRSERPDVPGGSFTEGTYTSGSGTRSYKLFVPSGHAEGPLPLVVMLHGCTQSPDDFATGTGMNVVAQERGFLVLYPAQAPRSNSSKCWNWFTPADQRRGAGEPDLLSGMTRHVMQTHAIDPARVYVAGLSAGGAMADILGREYPDLFAAVGVHSGLPQGAAHDVASAFAAMSQGDAAGRLPGAMDFRAAMGGKAPPSGGTGVGAPTIVFHGDADSTVHPSNGERVIDAALRSGGGAASKATSQTTRTSARGRNATRTVHHRNGASSTEPSLAEHWVVHGAAHAWSGGNASGSFADARGPDASREMIRFFEEHPLQRA